MLLGAGVRIARGAALVVADAVEPVHGIGYLVASEPGRSYWVQGVDDVLACDCEDAGHRANPCKHGWGGIIHTAAERMDADATNPSLLPFPSLAFDPDADRFELTAGGVAALNAMTNPSA